MPGPGGEDAGASTVTAERQLLIRCLGRLPGVNVLASPERRPRPLDLAVFAEARPTASQAAGRMLGVVVSVAGDRVEFLYARNTRAGLGVLNLRRPDRRRDPSGAVDNTYLRVIQPADPKGARYLAGQLLSGFAVPSL